MKRICVFTDHDIVISSYQFIFDEVQVVLAQMCSRSIIFFLFFNVFYMALGSLRLRTTVVENIHSCRGFFIVTGGHPL